MSVSRASAEKHSRIFRRRMLVHTSIALGLLSPAGKVFAGAFALYSGLVVIAVTGLLLGPGVHHLMRRVHWDEDA